MNRIRVMHVLNRIGLAGTEYGVIKLVNALDPDRFEPCICCLLSARPVGRALVRPGVTVHDLHRKPGRNYALVGPLAALLRRERVQVVHSHNWSTFLYTAIAARIARTPIRIHGEHGRETEQPARGWARRTAQRSFGRWYDQITTVSQEIADHVVADWKIAPERVTYVPNGVDLGRFGSGAGGDAVRRELGVDPMAPLVGSVGGFRPVKDYSTLLRAFGLVLRRHPHAKLVLVGLDPERSLAPPLERERDALGIPEHSVLLLGKRQDVPDVLAALDVYVNSSVYEGMSNTILEAMASRRAVVATAVGGNPDLVEDGVTGLLVPPRDPEALARSIAELLDDRSRTNAMGIAGRARVEECHRQEDMFAAYATIYETLLRRRERPWRPIDVAKRMAGWSAHVTGLSRKTGALSGPWLTILSYHRVLPLMEKERTACQGMIVPADVFARQIATLAKGYHPLSLAEVRAHLRDGIAFPKRAVWVTFDDGYADNFTAAFPILRRHGVSATFFLTTGFIDSGNRLWWDEVSEDIRAIHAHHPADLQLCSTEHTSDGIRRRLEVMEHRDRIGAADIDELIRQLNRVPETARIQFVESTRRVAREFQTGTRSRLMLTWDQVRTMRAAGMDFGGHTISHRFLDTLDAEEGIAEVVGSMRRIEVEIGEAPVAFSYPKGRFNSKVRDWLARVNVQMAVTSEIGVNDTKSDPLALKRRDAGYLSIQDTYLSSYMSFEMSGALDWMGSRRLYE